MTPLVKTARARLQARPRARGTALGLVAIAVVAVSALAPPVAAGQQPAPVTYYVAIGASETLGFQPNGPGPTTHTTDVGYTNDVITMEQARWPGLQLVRFACPGLRMEMALSGGQPTNVPAALRGLPSDTTTGRCHREEGSEVGTAAAFIRAHPGQVVLVTLDLGYPDVATCFAGEKVNATCMNNALTQARSVLPEAVSLLRTAGGSSLRIVGLDHDDPFLADYLGKVHPHTAFAEETAAVTEQFNRVVNTTYASVGVRVAEVGAAFDTGLTIPAKLAGWGTVPLDVEQICNLTWMCSIANIHPNAAGYAKMADAIAATIPENGGLKRASKR